MRGNLGPMSSPPAFYVSALKQSGATAPNKLPHAGMGIASFVILMLSAGTGLVLTIMLYAMAASKVNPTDEASPIFYVIGGWMFSVVVLSLVGIVFGIGGVLQKGRRRHFAVIGLLGNLIFPLALMALLVLRMTYAGPTPGLKPLTLDSPNWDSPVAIGCMVSLVALLPFVVLRFVRKGSRARGAHAGCPRCGKAMSAGARFCRRCGQVFGTTQDPGRR